jgi:hypothetical protein
MIEDRFDAVSTRVQEIVRELAKELAPVKSPLLDVRADSDLERDLGLDRRAELLHRLEREFKIRLSEQLLVEAVNPLDLARGVLAAQPSGAMPEPMAPLTPIELAEVAEPRGASTLLDALSAHVRRHGSRPHLHLWRNDAEEASVSYAELDAYRRGDPLIRAFGMTRKS